MASITSVISFFILLLVTYSYSAPIGHEYGSSTTKYEFTSDKTTIEHGDKVKKSLISGDESTQIPTIHKERSSEESNIDEDVTRPLRTIERSSFPSSTEINEKRSIDDSFPSTTEINEKRSVEDFDSTSTELNDKRSVEDLDSSSTELNEKRSVEDLDSTELNEKRSVEDLFSTSTELNDKRSVEDLYSTSTEINEKRSVEDLDSTELNEKRSVEHLYSTSTEINEKRSVEDLFSTSTEVNEKRSVEDFLLSNLESSAAFEQRAIRPALEEEIEASTSVFSKKSLETSTHVFDPLSSSVNLFGHMTGLLHENESDEQSSTTDRIDEESTTDAVKSQKLIKTIAIIPGIITETKISVNTPSKAAIVIQSGDDYNPVQKRQVRPPN